MTNHYQDKKKALFLYFELAGYVVACLDRLASKYPIEIHLVRYPINPIAPFDLQLDDNIYTYERKEMSTDELISLTDKINPDFVFVNGWSDKGYIGVCKHLKKRIPTVLTFDNPWLGTIKQYMATIIGPFFLHKLFTHCWVPGEPNAKYARKLGFDNEKLFLGMYSADTTLFESYYQQNKENKENKFPHRFIYVGRYTQLKGTKELWDAFNSLTEAEVKDWELWCLGKGELENPYPTNKRIKNIGFVQPKELSKYIAQTGVFILPAYFEHWGVVVHEFAAAGFPMICSTRTSAATAFLKEDENGYFVEPKSKQSIKSALIKMINHNDKELTVMGIRSNNLSKQITPDTWSDTVWKIINTA